MIERFFKKRTIFNAVSEIISFNVIFLIHFARRGATDPGCTAETGAGSGAGNVCEKENEEEEEEEKEKRTERRRR